MNRTLLLLRGPHCCQLHIMSAITRRLTTAVVTKVQDPFSCRPTPVVDIRPQTSFLEDHIPGSINIPLIDDVLGTGKNCYGSDHYDFITKNANTDTFINYFNSPECSPLLYCENGGMKSQIAADILSDIGVQKIYLLQNGYLSYRKLVTKELNELPCKFNFKVLSGLTGTGKTFLLNKLSKEGHQILDLECLAKHKGSILGLWYGEQQPPNSYFKSLLRQSLAMLDPSKPVWVESESIRIGRCTIPEQLFEQLCNAERFRIVLPIGERIKCSMRDYPYWMEDTASLKDLIKKFVRYHGEQKVNYWISLIEDKKWEEFVHCLLVDHYDPTYTMSQRKNNRNGKETDIFMENQSEEVVKSTINHLTGLTVQTQTDAIRVGL